LVHLYGTVGDCRSTVDDMPKTSKHPSREHNMGCHLCSSVVRIPLRANSDFFALS
jgi:hypothetical protein